MAHEPISNRATRKAAGELDCAAALDRLLVLAVGGAATDLSAKSAAILSADLARTLADRLAQR